VKTLRGAIVVCLLETVFGLRADEGRGEDQPAEADAAAVLQQHAAVLAPLQPEPVEVQGQRENTGS